MKYLDDVTLCAVDSRAPHLAVRAMRNCMAGMEFGDRLLITSNCSPGKFTEDYRVIKIPVFDSSQQYSHFILSELGSYFHTSHVLIVQWDGFVLHPDAWDDEFLEYDYIGAPWPHHPIEQAVGNGGFSLRSRRLFEAMQDINFVPSHPEDLCICHHNRTMLENRFGIRFAPLDLAERFSYERARPRERTFGFHGFFNFPDFMPTEDLNDYLSEMTDDMLCNRDTRDLIARLARTKARECKLLARRMLIRHLESCRWNLKSVGLTIKTIARSFVK